MVWSILKHQALTQNICCVYFWLSQEVDGQYPEELSESGFIGRKCVDRGTKNPAQHLCYFQLLMWATAVSGVDVDELQKTHHPPSYRAGVTASSGQSGDLYRTIWSLIKCCLVSGSISRWQQLEQCYVSSKVFVLLLLDWWKLLWLSQCKQEQRLQGDVINIIMKELCTIFGRISLDWFELLCGWTLSCSAWGLFCFSWHW